MDIDIDEENGVYEGLVIEIKRILEKLRNEKIVLKQQQEGLKSALEIIAKFIKGELLNKIIFILSQKLIIKQIDFFLITVYLIERLHLLMKTILF